MNENKIESKVIREVIKAPLMSDTNYNALRKMLIDFDFKLTQLRKKYIAQFSHYINHLSHIHRDFGDYDEFFQNVRQVINSLGNIKGELFYALCDKNLCISNVSNLNTMDWIADNLFKTDKATGDIEIVFPRCLQRVRALKERCRDMDDFVIRLESHSLKHFRREEEEMANKKSKKKVVSKSKKPVKKKTKAKKARKK